jgi:hypothetical protein
MSWDASRVVADIVGALVDDLFTSVISNNRYSRVSTEPVHV